MLNCAAKRFYDTEFEATIAAAKATGDFKTMMTPYLCDSHWHIGNEDVALRSRYRSFNRSYCKPCDSYMRPARYKTHITREGHIRAVRDARKEKSPQREGS